MEDKQVSSNNPSTYNFPSNHEHVHQPDMPMVSSTLGSFDPSYTTLNLPEVAVKRD